MKHVEYRCEACGLWMPSWWGKECRRCSGVSKPSKRLDSLHPRFGAFHDADQSAASDPPRPPLPVIPVQAA